MKNLKKLTAFILLIITLFSFTGCAKDENLGAPSAERFGGNAVARCVWDVKVFDGKVYIGSGDYSANTAPTDIWAYDLSEKDWVLSGSVEDESVLRFIELDETLLSPGTDPSEPWALGNFYTLSDGTWVKNRVLPNVIHNFDITDFDGKRMFAVGSDYGVSSCALYTEDGETYTYFDFYANNNLIEINESAYNRGYDFFKFKNELYILTYLTDTQKSASIFKYSDGAFHYYSNASSFFKNDRISVNMINAKAEFRDKYYFITDDLYYTEEQDAFKTNTKVELPNGERAVSIKVTGDEMIILSYVKTENGTYDITLYSTKDGINFTKLRTVNFEVPPISFDIDGKFAFVGCGDKTKFNKNNGTVLKIKL